MWGLFGGFGGPSAECIAKAILKEQESQAREKALTETRNEIMAEELRKNHNSKTFKFQDGNLVEVK